MDRESQDPIAIIERALLTMRRDQQARRLQRQPHPLSRRARGPLGHNLGGAALFRMLDSLEAGPRTVTELASAAGVDQPRASRLVAQALDYGMVRRGTDPSDARRSIVELTGGGRQFLVSAHESRRGAVVEATAGFSAEETELFAGLLERFVGAWPRPALEDEEEAEKAGGA